MEDKQWGIFGYIPEEHFVWFEQNSGTYWDSKQNVWKIDGSLQEKTWFVKDAKAGRYKANTFQKRIETARNFIKDQMAGKGGYKIDNEEIFELMRNGATNVNYTYQGKDFIQRVSSK